MHHTSGDINKPSWQTADRVTCSSEGSSGVLFVRTSTGSLVIKGTSQIGEEIFASHLAKALGLPTPRARLTSFTQPEWGIIKQTCKGLSDAVDDENSISVKIKVYKELDRPVLLILEMVTEAVMLEGMLPDKAKSLFDPDQADGQRKLEQAGRMIAFDILVNNSDRIPTDVWDNEGNGRNVLVTNDVVAIDQAVVAIDPDGAALAKYLLRAEQFLVTVCTGDEDAAAALGALRSTRDFWKRETLFDIGEKGCALVIRGIREGVANICTLSTESLQELKHEVERMVPVDWAQVWEHSIAKVNLGFLSQMLALFQAVAQEAAHSTSFPQPRADLQRCLVQKDIGLSSGVDEVRAANEHVTRSADPNTPINPNFSRFKGDRAEYLKALETPSDKAPTKPPTTSAPTTSKASLLAAIQAGKQPKLKDGAAKQRPMGLLSAIQGRKQLKQLKPSDKDGAPAAEQRPKGMLAGIGGIKLKKVELKKVASPAPASAAAAAQPSQAAKLRQQKREAAQALAQADAFLRQQCGTESTISSISRLGSHEAVLEMVRSSGIDARDVLVAFDFDQTLTTPAAAAPNDGPADWKQRLDAVSASVGIEKVSPGGRLRGGQTSLDALTEMNRMGTPMMVVTAAKPTAANAKAIATEANELGLGFAFQCEPVDKDAVE
jgi:hypothetical protein